MKISAFRIKNYRSIVDSGWCYLSHDNISALIGQNESGKTSVLESLNSFYEGVITDDILRSDQTLPEITCEFQFENEIFPELVDLNRLKEPLLKMLQDKKVIRLTRRWTDSKNSIIEIAEPEIIDYFRQIINDKKEADKLIRASYIKYSELAKSAFMEVEKSDLSREEARNILKEMYLKLENSKKNVNKSKRPDEKITAQISLEKVQQAYQRAETEFNHRMLVHEEKKMNLQDISEKASACRLYIEAAEKLSLAEKNMAGQKKIKSDNEHQLEACSDDKERKNLLARLDTCRINYQQIKKEIEDLKFKFMLKQKTAVFILEGKTFENIEEKAVHEIEEEKRYFNAEEIGSAMFEHIPLFEFFEDFSSLLPNKIDLEDLLNENSKCEGYKAARNFLQIAGLDAEFFREKNHRILKQKIENLNSEISVDFQDYWQQNVGKNNKIKINFELEHYDYTQPEKSGKPYLEFWIKDKQERLYPKQRSRGVRWFLSFYLELKATAKANHYNRVMLIDEPGLSLHARAQEDVLKVFEDLKDKLQIIYCTHSAHLIDSEKLYRVLAVQRATVDENSETVVIDSRSLHEASRDTLMPVYSLIGSPLNEKSFISQGCNIILEDNITYSYLIALAGLIDYKRDIHFIPSNNIKGIPLMVNLFVGWKLNFGIVVMESDESEQVTDFVRKTIFLQSGPEAERKIKVIKGYPLIEDLFSTIDFKRYILQQRMGITEKNSRYIEENDLCRMILAKNFNSKIISENVKFDDFDEETRANVKMFFSEIDKILLF